MHHLVEVEAGPSAEILIDRLWGHGAVGVEELEHLVRAAFTDADVAARVARQVGGVCRSIEDHAGLDGWRRHASRHRAGPFGVRPPWLDPVPGTLDLVIDPGHAFGSGSHPSTRLVLALTADLVSARTRVVDLGTGSGILAVAAARLGAVVEAVDTDPAAATAVGTNAAANDVTDRVTFRAGDAAGVDGNFDLGLCNMTIDIHERLGPSLTADIGRLIVGGILTGEQEQRAAAAHRREISGRRVEGEWVALVLA